MSDTTFEVDKDKLEVTVTKTVTAARERVWRAYTTEEIIEWWGPAKYKTTIDQMDVRVGGKWRFIQTDADGQEYAFHGVYQEVNAPERAVQTFVYEPFPNMENVDTLTLEAVDDNTTKITTHTKFPNIEALEGMVGSGMEGGLRESLERLEAVVTA